MAESDQQMPSAYSSGPFFTHRSNMRPPHNHPGVPPQPQMGIPALYNQSDSSSELTHPSTMPISASAVHDEYSDDIYNEQLAVRCQHPNEFEMSQEEYRKCSKCKELLTAPYITFRMYLDTEELVSFNGETAIALEDVHILLKIVNALLNDGTGIVFVHCSKPCPVTILDKKLDHRLKTLIASETLYDDNFERHVVDNIHVVYRVKPTPDHCISVLDFHSFLSDNQGLVAPSQSQIQSLIHSCFPCSTKPVRSEILLSEETQTFQYMECVRFVPSCKRHFHAVDDQAIQRKQGETYGTRVAGYWWEDLNLAQHIAALCKQQAGGRVYLGIAEQMTTQSKKWTLVKNWELSQVFESSKKLWVDTGETSNTGVYHLAEEEDVPLSEAQGTGVYICHGVELDGQDQNALQAALMSKIQSEMLWYPEYPVKPPVEIKFHPMKQAVHDPRPRFVVEVMITKFHGLAFHNKTGPEAYGIRTVGLQHMVRSIPLDELISKMNAFITCSGPMQTLKESFA